MVVAPTEHMTMAKPIAAGRYVRFIASPDSRLPQAATSRF